MYVQFISVICPENLGAEAWRRLSSQKNSAAWICCLFIYLFTLPTYFISLPLFINLSCLCIIDCYFTKHISSSFSFFLSPFQFISSFHLYTIECLLKNSAHIFRLFGPILHHKNQVNGKAFPLQAWSDPEGSRKLSLPDYMTTAQDCGTVVSPTHWPSLLPGNTPGTLLC